jgi:hypothetical protein
MIHLIQLLSALIGNVHHWWKLVRPSLTELLITPKTVCLASYVELEIHIESIACLWSSDCSLFSPGSKLCESLQRKGRTLQWLFPTALTQRVLCA